MGQNSTEVAYGFGQMGSVFTNENNAPVFPPKGMVICAIQFISPNTLTVLETETLDTHGSQYITTEDDELESGGGPDNNFGGVTFARAASGTAAGVITIADTVDNLRIKAGQVILVGGDAATHDIGFDKNTANAMLDAAINITPIYNGPNKQFFEVVSISGGTYGTTVTVKGVGLAAASIPNIASIDANNTIFFLDSYHGAGGTTTEGTSYPTGIIIYGRWVRVEIGVQDDVGGVICYYGY